LSLLSKIDYKHDSQCACKRNMEVRLYNRWGCGKAIRVTYSECVSVTLLIHLMFSVPKCYINTTCQSITQHFILYTIRIVYCQGDMFRPFLGHLQALWENKSKSFIYFNALWDRKCIWDPTCRPDNVLSLFYIK